MIKSTLTSIPVRFLAGDNDTMFWSGCYRRGLLTRRSFVAATTSLHWSGAWVSYYAFLVDSASHQQLTECRQHTSQAGCWILLGCNLYKSGRWELSDVGSEPARLYTLRAMNPDLAWPGQTCDHVASTVRWGGVTDPHLRCLVVTCFTA